MVLAKRGCDWPCSVEWDDLHLVGHLTRGELRIPGFVRRLQWWYPGDRGKAERLTVELANVLHGWFRTYQLADETGRMHVPMWRDAQGHLHSQEPPRGGSRVTVVLEPGIRLLEDAANSAALVYRLEPLPGVKWGEAVERGWVRVEG